MVLQYKIDLTAVSFFARFCAVTGYCISSVSKDHAVWANTSVQNDRRVLENSSTLFKVTLAHGFNKKYFHLDMPCRIYGSSRPEVFLRKGVLKICCKFTGEHPCQSAISIELQATLLKSHFGMGVLL